MQIPRKEYPRPQFERKAWLNLNGEWQFQIDHSRSGIAREIYKENVELNSKITVPFCPESRLSGIEHTDFIMGVWYKRKFTLEEISGRTVLHFGAVDYHCRAYINGILAGEHKGGYVSFSFDITDLVREGENEIAVYAEDDTRNPKIPSGKQSEKYNSFGCYYTRTTGIWQTVWLEFTPESYIKSVKYYPNIKDTSVTIEAELEGKGYFTATAYFDGKEMGCYNSADANGKLFFTIPLKEKHLWEVGNGRLYDMKFTFGNDIVESYFGLREVRLEGNKFLINGKSVFQRLVLDQGFYPDGIYTAPTDDDLKKDIELSLNAGFNGARLHEKVFEERFLYHADKLGYIVWGEYPNWGLDISFEDSIYPFLPEWLEILKRDFNHPSIIGWCPFNETWEYNHRAQFDGVLELTYLTTKAIDTTRPCLDTSGGVHVKTDIFDIHDYEQNPELFSNHYTELGKSNRFDIWTAFSHRQQYDGKMPFFVSEYGGIGWSVDENGWGYGNGPKTIEEFYERFKGLADVLLDNDKMFGFCYTQLTDVEQEQNGLYQYNREPKFDTEILRKALNRKAAIED